MGGVKTGGANKVKTITKVGKHKGRKGSDGNERKGDYYKIKQSINNKSTWSLKSFKCLYRAIAETQLNRRG